jgi:hypothetical protein
MLLLLATPSKAEPAASSEVEALRAQQREGPLDAGRAGRLARLLVPGQADWATVQRALARFHSAMAAIIAGGPMRSEWLGDTWLKKGATAESPEAKALFERVFLDQWQLKYDPKLSDKQTEAFGLLAGPDIKTNIRANASWLKAVLARIGWFDISHYGSAASQGAWLLVQHSDHDPIWQKQMLAVLEPRVARGDMQGSFYAYLVDRVATGAKQPQTFGTQGHCVGTGNWQPFQTVDPNRLDERRKAVGLEPIDEYRTHFTCR